MRVCVCQWEKGEAGAPCKNSPATFPPPLDQPTSPSPPSLSPRPQAGAAVGAAAPARRAGLAAVFASRSLLGAAMGCSFQAPAMLLAEVAPRALRGRALFTNNLALLLGFLLSALANQALAHREWGWRASAALVAAPGAVLAALLPWVRESPQVLLQRGDRAGARAVSFCAPGVGVGWCLGWVGGDGRKKNTGSLQQPTRRQ